MTNGWAQQEHERAIGNFIRRAVITEVNYEDATCRVQVGGFKSDWLDWLALSSGGVIHWRPPSVNEQCVLLAPYGDTTQGVVIPGLYRDDFAIPSTDPNKTITKYPDGSTVEFDHGTSTLTVNVGSGSVVVNCATARVNASTSVTVDSPDTEVTGNLKVGGNAEFNGGTVTHGGVNIGKDHVHGGVTSGSSTTLVPQ